MHTVVRPWRADVSGTVLRTSTVLGDCLVIFKLTVIRFLWLRIHTCTSTHSFQYVTFGIAPYSFIAFILIILTCAFTPITIPHRMP